MGDYRSRSYGDGRMQIEKYYGPTNTANSAYNKNGLRSYSASYTASGDAPPPPPLPALPPPSGMKDWNIKKANKSGGSTSTSWGFKDPEFQRKKRVASYKVYSVEGKVKGSFRKSFRWLKDKYSRVVYGWW